MQKILTAILLCAPSVVYASPIIVGTADSSTCIPLGCGQGFSVSRYQEVYSSSAFLTGILTIDSIDFTATAPGETFEGASLQISFSTTQAAVGNLSAAMNNNVGNDVQMFGTFFISGTAPVKQTFSGTPFTYNPANGNLLMDMSVCCYQNSGTLADTADDTVTVVSSAINEGGTVVLSKAGLVTQFDSAVPEPATAGSFALGLLALAARRQRNRSNTV